MSKKDKTKLIPLDNFNFDFVELLEERDLKQLIKDVKEEMFLDCKDIEMIISEHRDQEVQFQYLINYTSKYAYFIYHFEQHSEYESCSELKTMFLAVTKTYFQVSEELILAMVTDSINSYRNIDDDER